MLWLQLLAVGSAAAFPFHRRQVPPSVSSAAAAATQLQPQGLQDYPFSCPGDLELTYLIQQTTYDADLASLVAAVGNWTNATFLGQTSASGDGQTPGNTRTVVINGGVTLEETLIAYSVNSSTGAVRQDWNLTNGPVELNNEIVISNYTFELQAYTNDTDGGSTLKMFINMCTNNQNEAQNAFGQYIASAQENAGDIINGVPVSSFSESGLPSSASSTASAISQASSAISASGSSTITSMASASDVSSGSAALSAASSGSGILPVPLPSASASSVASSAIGSASTAIIGASSSAIASATAASSILSDASMASGLSSSAILSSLSGAASGTGIAPIPIPTGGSSDLSASAMSSMPPSANSQEASSAMSSALESLSSAAASGASSASSALISRASSISSDMSSASGGTGIVPVPVPTGSAASTDSNASSGSAAASPTSMIGGASSGSSEMSMSMSSAMAGSLSLSSTGVAPTSMVPNGQLFIDAPMNFTQCEAANVTFGGGRPPYFISIIPGDQPTASALVNFPLQSVAGTYTYFVDLPAGTNISLSIVDRVGSRNVSMSALVEDSNNSTCLDNNMR